MRGSGEACIGAATDLGAIVVSIITKPCEFLCFPGVAEDVTYLKYLMFLFTGVSEASVAALSSMFTVQVPAEGDVDYEATPAVRAGVSGAAGPVGAGESEGVTTRSMAHERAAFSAIQVRPVNMEVSSRPRPRLRPTGVENEYIIGQHRSYFLCEELMEVIAVVENKMDFLMGSREQRWAQ